MTNKLFRNGENPPDSFEGTAQKPAGRWTPERRAAQAEWMRTHKPWLKSTGPRSDSGKRRVADNATKHGFRSQDMQTLRHLMAAQRQWLKGLVGKCR